MFGIFLFKFVRIVYIKYYLKMRKFKIIAIAVLVILTLTGVILYMIPWGEAESEIKELEITETSNKIESEAGIEINDIKELNGVYTTYDIESATSELMFSIDAMQGTVGKFKNFRVSFLGSPAIEKSKIDVEIDVSSIYTANKMRDKGVKGDGFFHIDKFPYIRFQSSSIVISETGYVTNGTIEMMGLSKEFSFPFSYKGKTKNEAGNEVVIFKGEFSLNRTEYGMDHTPSVGDEVKVTFEVQLQQENG